jgi:RNA polymerase sigma-70 factor (ECF subfamily)
MTAIDSKQSADERLARWVREHAAAVRGYLLGLTRRHDLADDLLQEVFARAWRARDQYREQGHERAFLLKVADRAAIDHARRRRAEVQLDEPAWREVEPVDERAEPLEAIARQEASDEMLALLNQLTPAQTRVLLLRFFGELTFEEIAQTLDCPLGTVLSHCRRGLSSLRQKMTADLP